MSSSTLAGLFVARSVSSPVPSGLSWKSCTRPVVSVMCSFQSPLRMADWPDVLPLGAPEEGVARERVGLAGDQRQEIEAVERVVGRHGRTGRRQRRREQVQGDDRISRSKTTCATRKHFSNMPRPRAKSIPSAPFLPPGKPLAE